MPPLVRPENAAHNNPPGHVNIVEVSKSTSTSPNKDAGLPTAYTVEVIKNMIDCCWLLNCLFSSL